MRGLAGQGPREWDTGDAMGVNEVCGALRLDSVILMRGEREPPVSYHVGVSRPHLSAAS